MWKLKDNETKRFAERVEELVSVDTSDLWKSFKDGVLQACDETCGEKRGRRDQGNTWWWNDEVKVAVANKKTAYKEFLKDRSEESKNIYKNKKNEAKKIVARAMRRETEKQIEELEEKPTNVFKMLRFMKKEGKDVEGGRCMRGKDGRLYFSERHIGNVWKDHMGEIMNEENYWDHVTEVDVVEGPIENVTREEVMMTMKAMKLEKATELSDVSTEMITPSGEIGISVMMEVCQRVLDGKGIPDEWNTSVVILIFKGKGDVMSCGVYI